MLFGNRKFILEDLSSPVWSQLKKYHPSGNLKFNNLGIFQSLKFRILMEKIPPISLKLNFTPDALGSKFTRTLLREKNEIPNFTFKKTPKNRFFFSFLHIEHIHEV